MTEDQDEDIESINIKPRYKEEWDIDWPTDYLRNFLSEDLPSLDKLEHYRCLPFLKRLGYDPEVVYTRLTYDVNKFTPTIEWFGETVDSLEVDAATTRSPEESPHLVVNTHRIKSEDESLQEYLGPRGQFIGLDKSVAFDYLRATGATYSVLISNAYLIIARKEDADWFDGFGKDGYNTRSIAKPLSEVDWEFADELKQLLRQPDGFSDRLPLSSDQSTLDEEWSREPERIEHTYFDLDIQEYQDLHKDVQKAESNAEKQNSLESLAGLLFNSLTVTEVHERNFRGKSNEIDLIIRNTGDNSFTVFDDYGQYILVECKNWSKPVSAKEVRDFAGKLEETGVQLGILFTRHGITGNNTDADRLIDKLAQKGKYIVVLDARDLKRISAGKSFYNIIDQRLWHLRFDPYSAENTFTDE